MHRRKRSKQSARQFLQARDAAEEARKKGYPTRSPSRRRFVFHPRSVDRAFKIEGKKLILSMGDWNRKRQPRLTLTLPKVPVRNVKEVEVVFDRKWFACLSYDDGIHEESPKQGVSASIDPGEFHPIASVTENRNAVVVTGGSMRSIHRLRNRKRKELQERMSRCKKCSRRWRKYEHAKEFVLSKSEAQLQDALRRTTKQFVD